MLHEIEMKKENSKITELIECNVQYSMDIKKYQEDIEQIQLLNESIKCFIDSNICYFDEVLA